MDPLDPPPALKRLGQNFLIDPNIVRKIVSLAEIGPDTPVLEIGPGRGVLTEALCRAAGQVTAIEIDARLHAYLSARQREFPTLTLIHADALTYPLDTLQPGTVVVANLPYYISTPLLFQLLDQRDRFPRLVLMLQNEVADRLVAKPGTADYGVLSVMAQYAAEITKAFRVSAECFRPRPDVGSAVVRLCTRSQRELTQDEEPRFAALVKAAFAHRRKTLVNSLKDEGYEQHGIAEVLGRMGLPLTVRAESLDLSQLVQVARAVSSHAKRA